MDNVPASFIESVLRASGFIARLDALELYRAWGRIAKDYWPGGVVRVTYVPYGPKESRLHYQIDGWPHIETRTLSREVANEISKTVTSILFTISKERFLPDGWNTVAPDNKEVLELLMRLDAPDKRLDLSSALRGWICQDMARYSNLLRTFTSLTNVPNVRAITPFLEGMASTGRLQSISFSGFVPSGLSTTFLVNYFFSASCRRLSLTVKNFPIRDYINRWEMMDPQALPCDKVIDVTDGTEDLLFNIDTLEVGQDDPELLEKISRKLINNGSILSIHRIDHSVARNAKVYVVFFRHVCYIVFD
uniref:Methyltransf_11 domain-containing protein n=1 Tax=Steinernema glaseri TaxID=37863 RepID=A0A1I7ZYS0_9BILA